MAEITLEHLIEEFKKDPRRAIIRAIQWAEEDRLSQKAGPPAPAEIIPFRAAATSFQGGYNVYVSATMDTDAGEELAGTPTCEIYNFSSLIDGPVNMLETFDPNVGNTYWLASFEGVYPEPDSAIIRADFFDQQGGVQPVVKSIPVPL